MIFLSRVVSMLNNTIHQITDNNYDVKARAMVFNATFSNISVISWRSVLMVEETGVPGNYHRPVASH